MTALLTSDQASSIDLATRRELLIGLGAAAVLAGCGGPADDRPTTEAVAGFPRTFDHELGAVELAREPERIVTVGDRTEFDSLVALGRPPVATGLLYEATTFMPWVPADGLDTVDTFAGVQNFGGVDIEAVAARMPDLILGPARDRDEATYRLLTGLAPVVATPSSDPENLNSWRDTLELVARCVGAEDRAAMLATAVADQLDGFTGVAAEVGSPALSVIANYTGQGLFVFSDTTPQGQLFTRLGFTRPPNEAAQGGDGSFELSSERVGDLAGDVVVLLDLVPQANDELLTQPLFGQLPAVRAGRVVRIPDKVSDAAFFASVLSLPWALDQAAALLRDTLR